MAWIPTAEAFPLASVGSSHNRFTSAEDNEEALLFACPAIGLMDKEREFKIVGKKEKEPYIPGLKRWGFTAKNGKFPAVNGVGTPE